jgi:MFS family permease
MGLVVVLIAVPAQLLLIKWPPPKQPRELVNEDSDVGRASSVEDNEQSLAEALKTFSFWGVMAAMFLMGNVVMGVQVHMYALLKDREFPDSAAILAVTVAGASIIAGRLVSGISLDRFRTDFVAFAFFVSPVLSLGLFSQPTGVVGAVIAGAAIGIAAGGETATAAVLSLKLFGHRAFGQIYACVLFAFSIGCGTGPWLMGRAFAQTKSYALSLGILAVFSLVAGVIALALGALNHWSGKSETVAHHAWVKAV